MEEYNASCDWRSKLYRKKQYKHANKFDNNYGFVKLYWYNTRWVMLTEFDSETQYILYSAMQTQTASQLVELQELFFYHLLDVFCV